MANQYDDAVKALCAVDVSALCAPYAVLAHVPNDMRRSVLTRALAVVAEVSDPHHREVLARAAVDLAAIRLDPATIEAAWEESPMPVPSLLNQIHQQALQLGRAEGREEGLEEAVASLLRVRFGDDGRIAAVAEALARRGATEAMAAIEAAPSLDDLS
jgi:flagellar biosynthesis/type III secretory pathway protein FliH